MYLHRKKAGFYIKYHDIHYFPNNDAVGNQRGVRSVFLISQLRL